MEPAIHTCIWAVHVEQQACQRRYISDIPIRSKPSVVLRGALMLA